MISKPRLSTVSFFILFLLSLGLLTTSQLAHLLGNREVAVGLGLGAMGVAWVLIVRLEKANLLSWPVLFATFFVAYVGSPTLEALLGVSPSHGEILGMIIQSQELPLEEIAFLGGVSLVAFAFGLGSWYALPFIKPRVKLFAKGEYVREASSFYWVGVGALLLGLALMLYDMTRVGGLQGLLTPRVERFYGLATTRGSLPAAPLVFAGMALAIVGWSSGRHRFIRGLLLGLLLFGWVAYLLIQGDRRFILYTLLVALGSFFIVRGATLRLSWSAFLAFFGLYILSSFFGGIRWLFTPLLQGSLSLGEAFAWVSENVSWSWFTPSSTEFMGPYTTLVFTLTDPAWWSTTQAPLGGYSYLFSLPNLLPRSLYPGDKWQTLGFQFSDYIYTNYLAPYFGAPVGFGLSPLAEAVLNFGRGFWAPLPLFFILGWVSGCLGSCASRRPLPWGIVYALLLPQAFNLNRIDLAWSFQEAVYYAITGLVLLAGVRLLLKPRSLKEGERGL
ncbi:hypothetical protein [Thermus scotoductus]|uniref:hypothetical protein n=1 Tax=Thermus scotoductus TaxID=37636 RepID=UPI000F80B493|nr:hypothetical protein [Thermus scotoductus]